MKIGKFEIHNSIRDLYEEAGLAREIRRSLNFILLGNLCSNLYGIICGGSTTAMVGLATKMGADDLIFGIITAIMQAAALLQIPFSLLVNRTHKRKKYMLTFGALSRSVWMFFGFIPLIVKVPNIQLWLLVFLVGISSCGGAMINVCWFPWFSDLAPITIRSRWLAVREAIMCVASILFGLFAAYLLDHLPEETKYLITFLIGGAFGVIDMLCFGFCKEVFTAEPKKLDMLTVFRNIGKNRPFMNFLIFWTVWCFFSNMAGTYMTPYCLNEIGLNFTQMMIFGSIAAAAATIIMVPRWGKAIFRYGSKPVMAVAAFLTCFPTLFYLLSVKGSPLPLFLYNFLGACFWSGSNLAANDLQLSASSDEERPSYIAVFSCVTALAGSTLGSLAGGALLDWWKNADVFTGYFDRYKALFLLVFILRTLSVVLLVPRMDDGRNLSVKEFLQAVFHRKKPSHPYRKSAFHRDFKRPEDIRSSK